MAGRLDILYLPLHVNNNHWTFLKIDLQKRTFSYGDSLSLDAVPPTEVLAILQWWLNGLRPDLEEFSLVDNEFEMPQQRDSFSCGVIVLCVLANLLLGYDSWTTTTARCQRMEWFIHLSDTLDQNIEVRMQLPFQ
jgi:Ulp1 family protease